MAQALLLSALEFVESFNYLGSLVTSNGDLKPEIDRRRGIAATAMKSLWKPLWRHIVGEPVVNFQMKCAKLGKSMKISTDMV